MKAKKLLLIASSVALVFAGCSALDTYSIDAPEDLSDKIAEYEAEKEAQNVTPDDAVEIEVSPSVVGADDNSSAWWTTFSQYFTLPVAKKATVKFVNYGGAANWNNYVIAVTTPAERESAGYAEYFVLRSDNYGWGSGYDPSNLSLDVDGEAPVDDDAWWSAFRDKMNGATVEATIDHASEGKVYLTFVATALDGSVITETFNSAVSFVDDINFFFVADGAHIVIEKAYMADSDYPVLPDSEPASIVVTGAPESVFCTTEGTPDVWGDAVATVTFEDGSTLEVAKEDLKLTLPDFSTPGTKSVVVTYNRTKKGLNAASPAAGYYNIKVLSDINSISATATAYIIGDATHVILSPESIMVTAEYSDETTGTILSNDCEITFTDNKIVYDAVAGEIADAFTVSYDAGAKIVTCSGKLVIAESELEGETTVIGNADNTTGWWSAFTRDWVVEEGTSQSVSFTLGSSEAQIYHNAVGILRKADMSEYGVIRMDGYGWQGANNTNDNLAQLGWYFGNDWPSNLQTMFDGAKVTVTVANNGAYASYRLYAEFEDESSHMMYADHIAIDGKDLQFAMTCEGAHLDFSTEDSDGPTVTSISITKQPEVTTYYVYSDTPIAFQPYGVEVTATYSDQTKEVIPNSSVTFSNIPTTAGSGKIIATYKKKTADINITVVKGSGAVGSANPFGGWWSDWSEYYTLQSGDTKTVSMMLYSSDAAIFNAPVVVLTNNVEREGNGYLEYAACRIDNFGWGGSYADCQKENNYPLDQASLPDIKGKLWGSSLTIAITNYGTTASVRFDLTLRDGTTSYYQTYSNIAVGDALGAFFTIDGCHCVLK